jgi:hypothetical protein
VERGEKIKGGGIAACIFIAAVSTVVATITHTTRVDTLTVRHTSELFSMTGCMQEGGKGKAKKKKNIYTQNAKTHCKTSSRKGIISDKSS